MSKEVYVIGVDIGGTKCAVTLASCGEGVPRIIEKVKFATNADKPFEVLSRFLTEIDFILLNKRLKYNDIKGIGISCGGPLNSEKGIIMCPPNLPKWDNIEICNYISDKTGIKCKLQNDANACAVAEWRFGAGKGLKSMVFLTFGTGLGAGLILDGKLYSGANDMAGEIGHVRLEKSGPVGYGKEGSCEGFCSGGGLKQLGIAEIKKQKSGFALYDACNGDETNVTAKLIAELARSGDQTCISIYKKCAVMLGSTISILCDILNPQAIIIGGIYMRSDDLLNDAMIETIKREAICPCPVLKAGLGENVGDYAALAIAL